MKAMPGQTGLRTVNSRVTERLKLEQQIFMPVAVRREGERSQPYGYQYVRKSDTSAAYYEMLEAEAKVVLLVFETYTQRGVSINAIARLLNELQIPTRTTKTRWERSTVWGIRRNPAYQGRACYCSSTRPSVAPHSRRAGVPRLSQSDRSGITRLQRYAGPHPRPPCVCPTPFHRRVAYSASFSPSPRLVGLPGSFRFIMCCSMLSATPER